MADDARARPKRSWIQEERRNALGHWVAFCSSCGHVQRFFEDDEATVDAACPQCGDALRTRCPHCDALVASAFAVSCEECGAQLRPAELFGGPIRKPGR
jgi:predicted RNA-binding Zn-ribbon protein involved in translation (DUF1610 family)